jgi:hypothetical protein
MRMTWPLPRPNVSRGWFCCVGCGRHPLSYLRRLNVPYARVGPSGEPGCGDPTILSTAPPYRLRVGVGNVTQLFRFDGVRFRVFRVSRESQAYVHRVPITTHAAIRLGRLFLGGLLPTKRVSVSAVGPTHRRTLLGLAKRETAVLWQQPAVARVARGFELSNSRL